MTQDDDASYRRSRIRDHGERVSLFNDLPDEVQDALVGIVYALVDTEPRERAQIRKALDIVMKHIALAEWPGAVKFFRGARDLANAWDIDELTENLTPDVIARLRRVMAGDGDADVDGSGRGDAG